MDFANVDPDIIRQATRFLSPTEIVESCKVHKSIDSALCGKAEFWEYLFRRDFSRYLKPSNYREEYERIGTELEKQQWENRTTYAAINGLERVLRSPYSPNSIMRLAAKGGQMHIVNDMLELGADDYNGAMASASGSRRMGIVKFFLDKGANDFNSSMIKASKGGHIDIVKFFLSKGARSVNSALIRAAKGGHLDIVELLVKKGANIDEALVYAAIGGHINIVEYLLSLGAKNYDEALDDTTTDQDIIDLINVYKQGKVRLS